MDLAAPNGPVMRRMYESAAVAFAWTLALIVSALAQAPSGSITGHVTDASNAVVVGARIEVINKETGIRRVLVTSQDGSYSVPALLPGTYELTADSAGFAHGLREAIVVAGGATSADFVLQVGNSSDVVEVSAASPQMRYDAFDISGVVLRSQIENLPLNGRSFLELTKLEPGGQQATRGSNNRTFAPLLNAATGVGNGGAKTRITVDGGSIMEIGNGGAAMGFSQEVVQEFQVSTANFDLTTGVTGSGSVNVITRSGTGEWHGSAFWYFRDHHLSAYPALQRDPLNPDPFFQRRQFGAVAGGPLRKNRVFLFATYERNEQRGVLSTDLVTPEFAAFTRITPTPLYGNQSSLRVDFRVSNNDSAFLRYSHEDNAASGPTSLTLAGTRAYPSAWTRQPGWADQTILGLTSQITGRTVNDLRFSYFFVSSSEQAPRSSDCAGCLGIGAPSITVAPDLFIGTSLTTAVLGRRFHLNDIVSHHKNRHGIRIGGDWEINRGGRTDLDNNPVTMTLFSPSAVRNFNSSVAPANQIPLPSSFGTLSGIFQLPVQSFTIGIGDPHVPQADFGPARIAPLAHVFAQDTWNIRERLTLNYGLAWSYDAPLNYDLSKPAYLLPVLGPNGLGPTRRNLADFSPSAGFSWSPSRNGKTVIRAGASVYYDSQSQFVFAGADPERVSLGPRGVGRGAYAGAGIPNPLNDVPGIPQGTLLNFISPTFFTGAQLLRALPAIQTSLSQLRGDPNNRDFSVRNVQIDKQGHVIDRHLPSISSRQLTFGMQREIAAGFVISVDGVLENSRHVGGQFPGIDVNHFLSARGPALQVCNATQRMDPQALCSVGPILLSTAIGTATYRGVLVRAEKRFSGRWQLLATYAFSSQTGNNFGNGFNNDDPLANYGPLNQDIRHILNLSGIVRLPKRFELSCVSIYTSAPPFSAYLGGIDVNGDGTTGDLLPGSRVNQFNRSLGKADLARLVTAFNQSYAGLRDSRGRIIPKITLPADYRFGDSLLTQDIRVSRETAIGEKWRLTMIGEIFNLFNVANLSGRSGDLLSPGFGQPTSRVTQVFGSGGPRAEQIAARISF